MRPSADVTGAAEFYGRLRKKIKVLNAESIYHTMQEMELSEIEYERLCREFCRDDHSRWEKEDEKKSPNPNRNRKNDWDDKREKMQAEMEAFSNEAADDSKELMDSWRWRTGSGTITGNFCRNFRC